MHTLPLYLDFANMLRSKIETGIYKYGQMLPTEQELANIYGIDRKTIRKAKLLLAEEGWIKSIQGKGTFVNKARLPFGSNGINGFTSISIKNGLMPKSQLLIQERRKAGTKYAKLFNLHKEDDILRILRIRQNDDLPLAVEDTYLPYTLIPDVEKYDFTLQSLMHIMLSCGIILDHVHTVIKGRKSSNELANVLQIEEGTPMFEIAYFTYDTKQHCVEYTVSYSPDKIGRAHV